MALVIITLAVAKFLLTKSGERGAVIRFQIKIELSLSLKKKFFQTSVTAKMENLLLDAY